MQAAHRPRKAGFTVMEVFAVIGVVLIMVALFLPALCKSGRYRHRPACVSNLKQTSLAFIVWSHDNEKHNLPFRVSWREGGTQFSGGDGPAPSWAAERERAYFQFAWVSNELESPKALVCPSDKQKHPAANWAATDSRLGFRHKNQQDNSVSYSVWLDGGIVGGALSFEQSQEQILLSDRHLGDDGPGSACSSGLSRIRKVVSDPKPTGGVRWRTEKNFGHGPSGSMGMLDGSVMAVNQNQLDDLFRKGDTDRGQLHYLVPQ